MRITIRDSGCCILGIIEVDGVSGNILEEKCQGLYISDFDTTKSEEYSYRMDFFEGNLLKTVSTKELLEEIERRIESIR